jgi:hypothetical protein
MLRCLEVGHRQQENYAQQKQLVVQPPDLKAWPMICFWESIVMKKWLHDSPKGTEDTSATSKTSFSRPECRTPGKSTLKTKELSNANTKEKCSHHSISSKYPQNKQTLIQ